MNKLIERMFANRGITLDYFRDISNPYYDKLKDIDALAVRLKEIHDKGISITIYPDFDMDGIASGDCFFAGLAELGFYVNLFIPDPSKGYGLSASIVDDILRTYPETRVILTCDNGITAYDAALRCKSIGIELLITDHHIQKGDISADIVVDPMRSDEEYPHPHICGAFVVYQVLQYYADLYCNMFQQDQIRRLRVFAGIGTVSDSMPLLYENRQVVKDAVDIMRLLYGNGVYDFVMNIPGCDVYRRAFFGLYNVLKVCESYGIIKSSNDITEEFFAFNFAPMFNAVKRLDSNAEGMTRAFGVFFADDSYNNMDHLYELNRLRKTLEQNELDAIMSRKQPFAPFVYLTDANKGILGLLANRIMGFTGTPLFVLHDEGEGITSSRFSGSGRSPEWYPCISRLSGHVPFIAGHENACAIRIDNMDQLYEFLEFFKADVALVHSETEFVEAVPDFVIATDWSGDTGIDIDLFNDYLQELDQYRPFGKGFPAPSILFKFFNSDVISWTQLSNGKHLKLSFHNGFDLLCWNQGALIDQKDKSDEHSVVGSLKYSTFRGLVSIVFDGVLQPV